MRYSLRTLLILAILVPPTLALAYFAWNRYQRRQQMVREWIQERAHRP